MAVSLLPSLFTAKDWIVTILAKGVLIFSLVQMYLQECETRISDMKLKSSTKQSIPQTTKYKTQYRSPKFCINGLEQWHRPGGDP